MQNCPTCNARLKDARTCRRCKTDLNKALEAADQAELHFQSSIRAYIDGRFETMLHHARRSFSLRCTHKNSRLLACAALLMGDYELALSIWSVIKSNLTN